MIIKKIISGILSMIVTVIFVSVSFTSSASNRTSVLLGDANEDGYITLSDSLMVLQFLSGSYTVSDYSFTAMDVNDDKVVDKTDADIILYYYTNNIQSQTVSKNLYTTPDYSSRYYKKYNCTTGSTTTYYLGTISSNQFHCADILRSVSPDYYDNINTNVVKLEMSNGSFGSGFVIDDHIIATAAHCVYDGNGFVEGITVKIYNSQEEATPENLVSSFSAQYYHIPNLYTTTQEQDKRNYDYALIYVGYDASGHDLLDYVSPWNFGVSSQEFSQSETGLITASGYTTYGVNNPIKRYYSSGTVVDFTVFNYENNYYPEYMITSLSAVNGGKSGGVMYYSSSYGSTLNHSAIGIITMKDGLYVDIGAWGTRVTPTLLRFYLNNPYV